MVGLTESAGPEAGKEEDVGKVSGSWAVPMKGGGCGGVTPGEGRNWRETGPGWV